MAQIIPGFFIVLFLSGFTSGQQQFEPTGTSYREAVARGQAAEYGAAMEALGSRAEMEQDWAKASSAYIFAAAAIVRVGHLQRALFHAETAVKLALKAKNLSLQITAMSRLADIYGRVGQWQHERDWLEKARRILEEMEVGATRALPEARLYRQLGENYLRQGDSQRAIAFISQSVRLWDARLSYLSSSTAVGTRYLSDTIEQANNQISNSLHRLGRAHLQAGNSPEAITSLTRGLAIMTDANLATPIEASLRISLGEAYLAHNELERAMENFVKGLQVSEERRLAGNMRLASGMMGDLLLKTGKHSEALSYYKRAVASVESTRSLFEFGELRASFFDDKGRYYGGLIRAYLDANDVEEAFNYSERARSRAFLDILGHKVHLSKVKTNLREEETALKERFGKRASSIAIDADEITTLERIPDDLLALDDQYDAFINKARRAHKEQASLMNVEPLTLREVQTLLGPGQSLIQYFVASEKIFLWVVERNRMKSLTVPISQKELIQKIDSLRRAIATLDSVRKYQSLAREIHEFLIGPALPHITGKKLIIVPHGVLHYLPFQALYSARGRYLVEDYSISYLSSASLLQFTTAKRKPLGQNVLAVGNPSFDASKANLPMTELEANEIRRLYPRSALLTKSEATEERVKELAGAHDVLHFATHAELNKEDPLSSAVLLSKGEKEDGRLEVREIFGMDLKASLVVLSACETGLGALSSGDELVGLTRAFIYAGTPSVVASLWKVDDASTAQLMSSFYRNLKSKTKVESLRQAQLDMIRGKTNTGLLAQRGVGGVAKLGQTPAARSSDSITTSHPYFWAPFVLVGDGK